MFSQASVCPSLGGGGGGVDQVWTSTPPRDQVWTSTPSPPGSSLDIYPLPPQDQVWTSTPSPLPTSPGSGLDIYPLPPQDPGSGLDIYPLPPPGSGLNIYPLPPQDQVWTSTPPGSGLDIYPLPPPRIRSGHLPPPPPPQDQVWTSTPPPRTLHAGGRYASYWNAFLLDDWLVPMLKLTVVCLPWIHSECDPCNVQIQNNWLFDECPSLINSSNTMLVRVTESGFSSLNEVHVITVLAAKMRSHFSLSEESNWLNLVFGLCTSTRESTFNRIAWVGGFPLLRGVYRVKI